MNKNNPSKQLVYSYQVIEFVTVVAETCLFLERTSDYSRTKFIQTLSKLLPLLYLKTSILNLPKQLNDDNIARNVTEDDYNLVKNQVEQLLGVDDSYLETFHPDMSLSDTPIAAFISENLADIYQELKDFAANYQTGNEELMNDALLICLEAFDEHWGQKLLNALRALHPLRNGELSDYEEINKLDNQSVSRNAIFLHLSDEQLSDDLQRLL